MKIAMIELTGKCPRSCATCLPKKLKSGRDLTWDEIRGLLHQLPRAGFKGVTLAGFGEPATHPDLDKTLALCRVLRLNTQVVCRPEHVAKAADADILRVSVQCVEDARRLLYESERLPRCPRLGAHLVLDNEAAFEVSGIFITLVPFLGSRIKDLSIACPLALCDDPAHLQAICTANQWSLSAWAAMRKLRDSLPHEKVELVRFFDPEPFADKCAFFKGMIYIDSNLKVRPCCHQPLGAELGDLAKRSVSKVLAGLGWKNWQLGGKKSAACRRCPDLGARP